MFNVTCILGSGRRAAALLPGGSSTQKGCGILWRQGLRLHIGGPFPVLFTSSEVIIEPQLCFLPGTLVFFSSVSCYLLVFFSISSETLLAAIKAHRFPWDQDWSYVFFSFYPWCMKSADFPLHWNHYIVRKGNLSRVIRQVAQHYSDKSTVSLLVSLAEHMLWHSFWSFGLIFWRIRICQHLDIDIYFRISTAQHSAA